MSIKTIVQPTFVVDTESEMAITWPDGCLVLCKDTKKIYQLQSSAWILMSDINSSPGVRTFNNAPGRSIVTGTGAVGFQVSTTKDAFVTYSPKIITTATIVGGADGYIVLEICSTNSVTPVNWLEVGRMENGQSLSLAITLQSVQPVGSALVCMIPAGWYAKLRSVNVTGTPVSSYISGQEVLLPTS